MWKTISCCSLSCSIFQLKSVFSGTQFFSGRWLFVKTCCDPRANYSWRFKVYSEDCVVYRTDMGRLRDAHYVLLNATQLQANCCHSFGFVQSMLPGFLIIGYSAVWMRMSMIGYRLYWDIEFDAWWVSWCWLNAEDHFMVFSMLFSFLGGTVYLQKDSSSPTIGCSVKTCCSRRANCSWKIRCNLRTVCYL